LVCPVHFHKLTAVPVPLLPFLLARPPKHGTWK
jgi:hypothetical protein